MKKWTPTWKKNEVLISSLWLPEILLIFESKARKNVTLHFDGINVKM